MSRTRSSATAAPPRADAGRWALLALFAGAVTIGFSGIFVRWSETGPIATGVYRMGIAGLALWLLPFFPSPLRDDGYDIADYEDVHPGYGTLPDFKRFLAAAHEYDVHRDT